MRGVRDTREGEGENVANRPERGEAGHPFTARLPQSMYDELATWAEEDSRTVNLEVQYLLRLGMRVERRKRRALEEASEGDDVLGVLSDEG